MKNNIVLAIILALFAFVMPSLCMAKSSRGSVDRKYQPSSSVFAGLWDSDDDRPAKKGKKSKSSSSKSKKSSKSKSSSSKSRSRK